MPTHLAFAVHFLLTVIAFTTTGRVPRLIVVGPRDLQIEQIGAATLRPRPQSPHLSRKR
jgi:hypothetical protein